MRLRSSANIELFSYSLLIRACKVQKISVSKMISRILKDAGLTYNLRKKMVLFRTVKYQPKGLEYKNVHFYLESEEYESCMDFRKFGKVSVSSVLNARIKKVLGKTIDKFYDFLIEMDNYGINYKINILENVEINRILIEIEKTWTVVRQIQ
ncbi:MAG: hypothetical protein KAZ87_01195 [Spirochaetes bacterium]|nr:hypothetical protein [Spirochaetota bacterium]